MADKKDVAKKWYKSLCGMLDSMNWTYDKDEEKLKISCQATWDDEELDIRMYLDAEREIAITWIFLDLTVPEAMRKTMAHAVNVMNYTIVHGTFDFGQEQGNLLYRCTSSYKDSVVSEEWFKYLLSTSCSTVGTNMGAFRRLVKGYLTVDELYDELRK